MGRNVVTRESCETTCERVKTRTKGFGYTRRLFTEDGQKKVIYNYRFDSGKYSTSTPE